LGNYLCAAQDRLLVPLQIRTVMSVGILRTLFYEKARSPEIGRDKICIVLGAGADISSGGLTFNELKRACLEQFSEKSLPSLMSPERVEEAFNEFFETLASERQRGPVLDFLFHGMGAIRPSDGYKLLVLLAKAGIIDAVITTNFDATLEAAQQELGLDVFQIYAPGVATPYVAGKHMFLPPRPLYVKLHGDIKSKRITHLTAHEVKKKPYDRAFSRLLQCILQTHILIFIGYSGNDEPFARELAKASSKTPRPIYWCNVGELSGDSTFVTTLRKGTVVSITETFENVLCEASPYVLRNLALVESKPHFLPPLLKDRINSANKQFVDSYAYRDSATRLTLIQARQAVLDQIAAFRFNSEKPMAVLTGLSGVGKTTLLCQLYDAEALSSLPRLLLLPARSITTTDFAEEIVMRLGYAPDNAFALLYEFSSWLRRSGHQLLVAVDGLNEFDWSSRKCLELFKEILRVALWVQPHNSLKLLVTMRPETWDELFSNLDLGDVQKVLWNASEFRDDLRTLHLNKFSVEETAAAYESYAHHFGVTTPLRQLPDEMKRQLADPYLLGLAMSGGGDIDLARASFQLYKAAFTSTLERSFGRGKSQSVDNALLRLASIGLTERVTEFQRELLASLGLDHEELRVLLEVSILRRAGAGYAFAHDRVHEYYLARAISELAAVQIHDWDELVKAVDLGRSYPRLAAALLQCVVHSTGGRKEHYLRLILNRLKRPFQAGAGDDALLEERGIDFCHGVFTSLAIEYPTVFTELTHSWLDGQNVGVENEILSRILIRASRSLPLDLALPLFLRSRKELMSSARREADVFIYDKVAEAILVGEPTGFETGPLSQYFFEQGIEKWRSAIRLLGIVIRVGPDNTHPNEWRQFFEALGGQLDRLFDGYIFPRSAEAEIAELLDQNAFTLLFNAGPGQIDKFFMASSRQELKQTFDEIDKGNPLTLEQVISHRQYTTELDHNIEFVILNLFFVISMRLDSAATLRLFSAYYDTFDERTPPEELDFFLSALCLSQLALGHPGHTAIAHYTEKMILNLPQISLASPGAARGARTALFADPFDQQFDDGFNPLMFYCYNAPTELRQSLHYQDYLKLQRDGRTYVPLYWTLLEQYEQQKKTSGILRVIHALDELINLWPIEGLAELEKLVGRTEPTIRRAIIRVLAEANARFPSETALMLSRTGSGFTEAEQFQIKWATDPHIAYRALGQVNWARVMYFLDQRDDSGSFFNKVTRALVSSFSLPEALGKIMNEAVIRSPSAR
jgi:NAD-dependent SIR2 family protein deacetylase